MKVQPSLRGQAPSAKGDGRPFTGPSGKTVMNWLGVDSREELEKYFWLENLFDQPLEPNSDWRRKSSQLTPAAARVACEAFLQRTRGRLRRSMGRHEFTEFIDNGPPITVVCLGTKVWKGFNLHSHANWFHPEPVGPDFAMVKFPHPSGLNLELNDPVFARETATRLRRIALGNLDAPYPSDSHHTLRQL